MEAVEPPGVRQTEVEEYDIYVTFVERSQSLIERVGGYQLIERAVCLCQLALNSLAVFGVVLNQKDVYSRRFHLGPSILESPEK